jgi:hypothetical protein
MTKSQMPKVAGVTNIVSGILTLIGFSLLFIFGIAIAISVIELDGCDLGVDVVSGVLFSISSILLITGILSIFGGVCALRRRNCGWALTGSICALIAKFPLGIVSTILVASSKDGFANDSSYEWCMNLLPTE